MGTNAQLKFYRALGSDAQSIHVPLGPPCPVHLFPWGKEKKGKYTIMVRGTALGLFPKTPSNANVEVRCLE